MAQKKIINSISTTKKRYETTLLFMDENLIVRGYKELEEAILEGFTRIWYLEDDIELAWEAFTGGFRREFERVLKRLTEDETSMLIEKINQYRTRDGFNIPGIEHLEVLEGYVKPARKHLNELREIHGHLRMVG